MTRNKILSFVSSLTLQRWKRLAALSIAIVCLLSNTAIADNCGSNQHCSAAPKSKPAYAKLNVGDKITFGNCIQGGMGQEAPIEWQVLCRDKDSLVLITTKGIAAHPYHQQSEPIVWSDCSLRRWLNNDFLNDSFNAVEKAHLVTVHLSNPGSKFESRVSSSADTDDKVFLLSHEEVLLLMPTLAARRCSPTAYAVRCGADEESNRCNWWLRSPGSSPFSSAYVDTMGNIDSTGSNRLFVAVRPVIKIAY